jgi:hypothetical protein
MNIMKIKVVVVCGEKKPTAKTLALVEKMNGGDASEIEYVSVGLNGKDCKVDYTHTNWVNRCFSNGKNPNGPSADIIVLEACPQRDIDRVASVLSYRVLEPLVRRVLRPRGFLIVTPSPMISVPPGYTTTIVHKNGRRTDMVERNEVKYEAFFKTLGLKYEGEIRVGKHEASLFVKIAVNHATVDEVASMFGRLSLTNR